MSERRRKLNLPIQGPLGLWPFPIANFLYFVIIAVARWLGIDELEEKPRLIQRIIETRPRPIREYIESGRNILLKASETIEKASLGGIDRVIRIVPTTIRGTYELVDLSGRGRLKEAVISTTSPKFKFKIIMDNYVDHMSYDEAVSASKYLEYFDAFEEDGEYKIKFYDLGFKKNFKILIEADEPMQVKGYARIRLIE